MNMRKYLMLAIILGLLPVKALAVEVTKLEMASTVRIVSQYSPEIADRKVSDLFDDANSADAIKYRKDVLDSKVSGSGVMITYDGCLLTSRHVLIDEDSGLPYLNPILYYGAELKAEPKEVGPIQLIYVSDQADLAVACLINNNGKFFQPAALNYELKDLSLSLGSDVYALGFPSVYGEYIKMAKGVISGYMKDEPLALTSMPFSPGMSGGPVFDLTNKVVSLVTGRSTDFSFGVILDPINFLTWREQLFSEISKVQPDSFKDCKPRKDNYFEKAGTVYYEADCRTKRNVGLDDQLVVDYKNFCGKNAVLEDHLKRQAAQYILSNKSNLLEWQKYLEWLCVK